MFGSAEDRGPRPAATPENPFPYLGTGMCQTGNCRYTWLRPEQDHICMHPTGKKMSRYGTAVSIG